MTPDATVDRLASLPFLAKVPRNELEWATSRGEVRTFAAGTCVRERGSTIDEMFVLLEGSVALHVPRGGGWRKVVEVGAGFVVGAIPYSRIQTAPGDLLVEQDATVFALCRDQFPDLIRDCPELTSALVHHMVDRAREFRTAELQDERMESLGRLASGLAHELNNPASAAARNARSLATLLDEAELASRALASARLTDAQLEAVDSLRKLCTAPEQVRSALEAADREDDIADWLARHGIGLVGAEALAACKVSLEDLEQLARTIPATGLDAAVRWVACGIAAREVAHEIESATGRVHELVAAVKGFTFMDREGVPDDVDIARGLADTVAVLENKSRDRSVEVLLETAADLPRVYGFGSEINQVWEKLIDNAIDAAGAGGKVTVTATSRDEAVLVRVADDGPGVPEEYRARVFDPFFTTKPVGRGTGLGLDTARRFVHLHHGDIDFTSQPGRTVFRVRLPVTGANPGRRVARAPDAAG
jgi:signal transduction histidine kinase